MPFIELMSRSKFGATKHGMKHEQSHAVRSYKSSSYQSSDDYSVAETPSPDSASLHLPDNLIVEAGHGLLLISQLPTFDTAGLVSNTGTTDLAVLIHRHYRAFQPPVSLPNSDWTWKKATKQVVLLQKAFPAVKDAENSVLAMAAWFHFLCDIDDEVEQMESMERGLLLGRITKALQTASVDPLKLPKSGHAKLLALVGSFIRQCQVVLSPQVLSHVFADIIDCLEGLKEEAAYQEGTAVLSSIEDYLRVRLGTIGLRPFFTILRHTLVAMEAQKTISTSSNNDTSSFWTSPLHQKLLNSTQRTIGLQNDIVGLSKDIEKGVRMNLAVVLLEQQHKTTSDLEAVSKARSMAVSIHNTEMQKVMRVWADIKEARYSTAAQLGGTRASVPVEAYESFGDVVECGAEYGGGGTEVQSKGATNATVDEAASNQSWHEVI
ncbi:hypothetical protein J3E74DRAFT_402880 [Bipolaris maydis]|nr:hypothetical protein J3E74DRAFT_402880 [Bipolaris maydis]